MKDSALLKSLQTHDSTKKNCDTNIIYFLFFFKFFYFSNFILFLNFTINGSYFWHYLGYPPSMSIYSFWIAPSSCIFCMAYYKRMDILS